MTEESRNKPLYMISVAAELTGMHPQTLRVYESKGLVNPKRSGGNGGSMTEESRNKPLYMISVAAELTGMHPQTLRVYESKGLVNPKRSGGNTRLYSQADIERLELINQLTDEGINLAGVVRTLDMKERAEARELEAEKQR